MIATGARPKSSIPGCDLPHVFRGGDQVIQAHRDEEIKDHPLVVIAADFLSLGGENRLPDEDHAKEGHDPKDHPQQEVPAVDKGVLQADVEDLGVLGEH